MLPRTCRVLDVTNLFLLENINFDKWRSFHNVYYLQLLKSLKELLLLNNWEGWMNEGKIDTNEVLLDLEGWQ